MPVPVPVPVRTACNKWPQFATSPGSRPWYAPPTSSDPP